MTPRGLRLLLEQHHGPLMLFREYGWFLYYKNDNLVAKVHSSWECWDTSNFEVLCAVYEVPF